MSLNTLVMATTRSVGTVLRHPLIRNFSFLAVGNLTSRALLFLVNVRLARVLLPEHYGKLVLAQTILLLGTVVADGGTRTVKVRDLATREVVDSREVGTAWGTMLLLSALATLLMAVTALLGVYGDGTERALLVVFACTIPAYGLNLDWVLKGQQRFGRVGAAETLKAGVYAGAVFALVRSVDDILLVPAIYAASWVVGAWYVGQGVRRDSAFLRPVFEPTVGRRLVAAGLPIGITGLLTQLYFNGGILFLQAFASSTAVGLYGAASKLTMLVTLMGGLFSETFLPSLARTFARSDEQGRRLLGLVLLILAGASTTAAVGGSLFARPILELVYGDKYVEAVPVLVVLSIAMVPLFCNIPFVNLLIVRGRQRFLLFAAIGGCAMNVTANLALTPAFGATGAAVAELLTETTVVLSLAFLALAGRQSRRAGANERTVEA